MAAKIRLKKIGRKGQPSYRVVVLDGRKPRDAKVVADLGHYDPKTDPATFEVDNEAALNWLLNGAKPTKAARDILSRAGVLAAWDRAKHGETVVFEKEQAPQAEEPPVTTEQPVAEVPVAPEGTEEAVAQDDAS